MKKKKRKKLKQNKNCCSLEIKRKTQKAKQFTWSREFLLVKKKVVYIVHPLKHIYMHFLMNETLLSGTTQTNTCENVDFPY